MSDKNFKVKNGLDAVGPITISPLSNATNGLIFNTLAGGRAITFNREGSSVGSIDDWGTYNGSGINIVQPWYVRSPGVEAQSFFWVGSGARSAAGFAGTNSGTNPVIYISQNGSAANDLTQWIKSDNTVLAKVDYLGNITANDLTLSGNLTVNGTTTNLNSTNLIIEDKNIIIADVATPTDTTADGAGITIKGATDKTLNWVQSTGSFTSSEPLIISSNTANNITLLTAKDTNNNKITVNSDDSNRTFITAQSNISATSAAGAYFTADGFQESWFNINTRSNTAGQKYMRFGNLGNKFLVQRLNDAANAIISTPFTIENTSATNSIYVNSTGTIINGSTALGQLTLYPASASTIGMVIRGVASQTANLQEWQNSDGTVLTSISPTGKLTSTVDAEINGYKIGKGAATTGTNNIAFGSNALSSNTTGSGNFAIGIGVLQANTTGGNNFALGANSLISSTTGDLNMALGNGVLYSNTTGYYNVGIGYNALVSNTTGRENMAIGISALGSLTTGALNTAVGQGAGYSTTTGNSNVFIGYAAGGAETGSNKLYIANTNTVTPLIGGDFSAKTLTVAGNATITSQATGTIGLIVKGAASQTADLQQWQDSGGSVLANVDKNGYFRGPLVEVKPTNPGLYGIAIAANASQSGDLFQITDASNNAYTGVSATGKLVTGNTTNTSRFLQITNAALGQLTVYSPTTTTTGIVVKGIASQTADLQQWQDSAGTVLNTIKSSGTLVIGGTNAVNTIFGITMVNKSIASYYTGNNTSYISALNFTRGNTTGAWMNLGTTGDSSNGVASIDIRDGGNNQLFSVGYTGNTIINLRSASSVGLIVKAAASQTANIFEIQDSTGYPYFRIDSGFNINNLGSLSLFTNRIGGAMLSLTPGYFGNVGAVIRGMSGQTADLQQWQNDSGTNLAKVDASGNITDASNTAWLSPIGSGSNDATAIQALIDAGKKEIRLGSGQWTFSTRIKVPNGVTIRGTGTSRSSTTGTRVNAVALIASEGTVRDIMFTGAGENAQSELGGGGIAVLGGRVIDCSVNDSRWVLAPTRQAHGYLKNFMSKMQGGYGSVKVAVLGDSLSENTSTTSWYGYLFDSTTTATGYYLGSYFGHQIAPSEVDNMAIGGQGAYLLSAQLAMTKETLRTGGYVNQVLDGDRVSSSPFFNRGYNLAILAIGQNGGEDWKAHLEYTVKTIRDKGIDVILLTQNPASGNPTSRAGDEYYYRSIAETYGCLLIDTQAYYRLEVEFGRALGTTADLFGDSVHQSTLGHQLYAKAILNGILDYDSTITVPANKTVVSRSYIPAETTRATVIAGMNAYYLVKKPDATRDISGVTYTTATDTSIRNPIYGRGTTTNSVATLASGGYATWGVEYANAAYIIYRENSTTNTLTVSLQNGGSTLATLTTGVTNGRTSVQKVTLSGGTVANRPIRITNTSGDPVQIYGVVFETHADVAFNRNSDGSYPGVKLNGSWSYGDFLGIASYGGFQTPYTSTTNAYATFKFYGDGLRFATSYGKNSGIIQVKIDDTTYTAVDTYNNIGEYGVYTHFYGGLQYGLHTATITLTGANASVTGNNSDGARFGLHRISAVRSSWYLTQDQQLAPNPDISAKVDALSSPNIGSTGSANIATFYNGTNGYGAGSIAYNGTFNINGANMGFPYTSTGATLNVNAGASNIIPLTVKGVASQTANLQEWQNSAGTVLASINASGNLILGNQYISSSGASGYGRFTLLDGGTNQTKLEPFTQGLLISNPGSTGMNVVKIQGTSGQTGDLTQWQNSAGTVLAKIDPLGNFTATSKSFDIEHPTKENMRLRYASLEGPENGVYIRGTATANIIELPDYWTGLVYEDSITVSLTSVGSAQNIYVEKIENNKVYIGGELQKAFFTVYGERKDIDKLTVEY